MSRTVVVTGAASGIGRAAATALNAGGWRVIGVDRHSTQVLGDLSEPRSRGVVAEAVVAACGGSLDGLVCAAGIGPTHPGADIVSVNYFGAVTLARALFGALRTGGGTGETTGAVMVSSNSVGLVPVGEDILSACAADDEERARAIAGDLDGPTAYAASKLALARWVRRAAGEWAVHGVRLNAVAPGPVETPLLDETRRDPTLGPLADALPSPSGRRAASPEEIAATIEYLVSARSSAVYGAVLFADLGIDASVRPTHI